MRLIDADALEEEFMKHHPVGDGGLIAKAPTVEERPKGKWVIDGHHRICTHCNTFTCIEDREGVTLPDRFCPNCGADMRGEEE